MSLKVLAPLAFLPLLAACAGGSDPWLAEGAVAGDAAPGGETLIQTLSHIGPECEVTAPPQIAVIDPPALGEIFTRDTTVTIESPVDEETGEVTEALPCEGVVVPATAVWYAAGSVSGVDRFVYRELSDGPRPNRDWRANVRVR